MPPFRWDFAGEAVLHEVDKAPPEVRTEFALLMDRLTRNPRDRRAGVRPLKAAPGGHTAPFDQAILVYRVLADYPRIELLHVVWISPEA